MPDPFMTGASQDEDEDENNDSPAPSLQAGLGSAEIAGEHGHEAEGSPTPETLESERVEREDVQLRWRSQMSRGNKLHALHPPYYNRPPVPLSPSPFFTSLLRPSLTTADSGTHERSRSSTRSTNQAMSTSSTARHTPTVPRAAPKMASYEYYGFATYLASSLAFLTYILWAYLPAPMLHQMGIHYYPNRWWALAVPCWLVVLIVYIYAALASYNTNHLTLPLDSVENVVDDCAQIAVIDRKTSQMVRHPVLSAAARLHEKEGVKEGRVGGANSDKQDFSAHCFHPSDEVDWKGLWSIGTDAVMDVPIGGVCEILYGD